MESHVLAFILTGIFASIDHSYSLRWCCKSFVEYEKCVQVLPKEPDYGITFSCVLAADGDCARAIASNEADIAILHSSRIFRNQQNLTVVGYEDQGLGNAIYYAIAVVKADNEDVNMCNLQNIKSCHTGIQKSSGWNTPIGTLTRQHTLDNDQDVFNLYSPFSSSCAPGANNPIYADKIPSSGNWCELCIGDDQGENICERNAGERYYGYEGAFRCLQDGAGDVAFIKHSIIDADEADDYSILCKNGTRAHPSDWETCHLARIPTGGIAMSLSSANQAEEAISTLEILRAQNATGFLQGRRNLWSSRVVAFVYGGYEHVRDYMGYDNYCNSMALEQADVSSCGCDAAPLQCSESVE